MYRLHIDNKPTKITTSNKIGAWDLVASNLWEKVYPNKELPKRWRAKFVKEEESEETNFDSLLPKEKVKALVEILENFHSRELCIVCGKSTKGRARCMIAMDWRWPKYYYNFWMCKECGK